METASALNQAQIELLEMTSFVKSDEMLTQMKKVIATYFANLLQSEINNLWSTGELNEDKIEYFKTLHERKSSKK